MKKSSFKFLLFLSSVKIAVIGILLLFILTFWGTIAQVENGLYASQERYFSSFYFLAMGFIPFPGAQTVLWILFINLLSAFFTRIIYAKEKIGLIIIHVGLLLFLITAFVTLHSVKESHLTLREGQSANVSSAYKDWEIAYWSSTGTNKTITAIDIKNFKEGENLNFGEPGLNFTVKAFHKNCQAFSAPFAEIKEKYFNAVGLNILEPAQLNKEPEKNLPGIILQFVDDPENPLLLLFGGEREPTQLSINGKKISIILRHKRFPMPLTVKLLDFMMDKHPGTEVARTYKSKVEIDHDGISREVTISMNEPLRFKNFTFYQASYQIDALGRESSTLAVVKNAGRLLPYIATFVTVFGLALHFLLAAFQFQRKRK